MTSVLQVYFAGVFATAAVYLYISYNDSMVGRQEAVARDQPVWVVLAAMVVFAVFSWVAFMPLAYAALVSHAVKDRP